MTEELRPSEVARRLGASTRTVQRWIADGTLPARRVGGRWYVASDAFGALPPSANRAIATVFVANRGEIARRIRRTGDRLGIRVVVPETDDPAGLDLLDIDAVVRAAVASGADALHPGFGFLAENAAFAEAVASAGVTWIGPPPAAIRAMGDKAAARRLASTLGVPVLAGYDDPDQSEGALMSAAERIGYPLLVKPAGGGGGKGMRTVRVPDRLSSELAAARREAAAAFGDDRLILERLVEGARHVEIQVVFDGAGEGVHLGERDCSIQRRHQKVLEEAGSPAVDARLRARLGDAALTLAKAVGYVGAGTCEFLVDDQGGFTFLEMNTRLQVEHPVTEFVTGRDLVADQIRIAAGEPLGLGQPDVTFDGHAVEVRLYAEDAENGFLPATGRIERLRWPTGEAIRVDAGVDEGDEIGGRYDPMLAKVIAWGQDRATALDRLTQALDQTVVLGLTTNLRFLRWLVRQPVVRDGEARTDTLDRIWPPDDWLSRAATPAIAWSTAAARALDAVPGEASSRTARGSGPDSWSGAWRLNAPPSVRLEADGVVRTVAARADPAAPHLAAVTAGDVVHVDVAGRSIAFAVAPPPDVDRAAEAAAAATSGSGGETLVAPMPGQVLAIHVDLGGRVGAGDPVATLEAMKMEHVVTASGVGVVTDLAVRVGDQVARGQRLARLEPVLDDHDDAVPSD